MKPPSKVSPGRVIRNADTSFPCDVSVVVSMGQAERSRSENGLVKEGFLYTTSVDTELPIKVANRPGPASMNPITLIEFFADIVCKKPNDTAIGYKNYRKTDTGFVCIDKRFHLITWEQYWALVCKLAKALLSLNFKPRDRVLIMGTNAPQWAIAHLGTIFAGGIAAGVYATNGVDAVEYIAKHSEAVIAIVDDRKNLEKLISVRDKCPSLRAIVVYRDEVPDGYETNSVVHWDDFLNCGVAVSDSQLTQRMEAQRPGHACALVYTSGTTGPPKAAMLSHDNYCWTALSVRQLELLTSEDRVVSYLPLSHIASQFMDIYLPITVGCSVYYAAPDALQGTLLTTLKEVRPTWFFAVPRVWEKFEERLRAIGAEKSALTRRIADWAKRIGLEGTKASLGIDKLKSPPLGHSFVKTMVLNKIHFAIGLDQCRAFGTGAAPMPPTTQNYFMSLGMPICDLYGLSETTGPQTFTLPEAGWFKQSSIGRPMPDTEVFVSEPNQDGVGELCFRGRNVFMGYFKDIEATKSAIDDHGFLHTGDIGYIDDNGFINVTGRLKELIITAGGENVAPILIESLVIEEMSFISNCQLIGDRRKFLSLLLCVRSTPDSTGQPTNNLAESTVALLAAQGSHSRTTFEAARDPIMTKLIDEGVARVNERVPSRAQKIRAWRLVPQEFTQEGGELTPSMKLKRNAVIEKYTDLIESMYHDANVQRSKL